MENVSGSPLASDAVGWKLYALPVTTLVEGVPEIVGGVFVVVEPGAVTVMENGASRAVDPPFVTLITMLEYVPASLTVGFPDSAPLYRLKYAQPGLFAIEYRRRHLLV